MLKIEFAKQMFEAQQALIMSSVWLKSDSACTTIKDLCKFVNVELGRDSVRDLSYDGAVHGGCVEHMVTCSARAVMVFGRLLPLILVMLHTDSAIGSSVVSFGHQIPQCGPKLPMVEQDRLHLEGPPCEQISVTLEVGLSLALTAEVWRCFARSFCMAFGRGWRINWTPQTVGWSILC